MKLELFTQKGRQSTHTPTISFSKTGAMRLNSSCLNNYFNKAQFVQLFHGEDVMAIKSAKETDPGAFKLTLSKKGNFATVGSKSFFKYYNIPVTKKSVSPNWNNYSKQLIINLKEEKPVKK